MRNMLEHPDITNARRTGYAVSQGNGNTDCPETRAEYIDDNSYRFISWVRRNYPELIDEYIELHQRDFNDWLN